MQTELVEPDVVTFLAVVYACTGMNSLDEGERVHEQIISKSLKSDAKLGTSPAVMYSCQMWKHKTCSTMNINNSSTIHKNSQELSNC